MHMNLQRSKREVQTRKYTTDSDAAVTENVMHHRFYRFRIKLKLQVLLFLKQFRVVKGDLTLQYGSRYGSRTVWRAKSRE